MCRAPGVQIGLQIHVKVDLDDTGAVRPLRLSSPTGRRYELSRMYPAQSQDHLGEVTRMLQSMIADPGLVQGTVEITSYKA